MNPTKMKIFSLILMITVLVSCKKDKNGELVKELEGRWELSKSSGGMEGKTVSYPNGAGNILEFNGLSFRETRNNQVIRSGTFKISKEVSLITKKEGDRIQFDNATDTRYFVALSNNTLSIDIDVFDPTSLTYKKMD